MYLPVPFCLSFISIVGMNCSWLELSYLVTAIAVSKCDGELDLWLDSDLVQDEILHYIRSFHSSVLLSRSTPPMPNVYIPSFVMLNPLDIQKLGHLLGALDKRRGSTQWGLYNDLPLDVWSFCMAFLSMSFRALTTVLFKVKTGSHTIPASTAIGLWKHRIPSDLRS